MKTFISISIALFLVSSAFAQKQADLRLHLQKGKIYRTKVATDQDISQTVMGQQKSTEVKSFSTLSIKPIDMEDTVINAEIRFDTIGYSNTMPKLDVASYKPGSMSDAKPDEVMNLLLNRLSNKILLVKLSNTGRVLGISNIKPVTDSVLAGVDTLKGQVAMMVQMQAKTMISEEGLKGMIETVTAYLPGKEVKTGDGWVSRIKITSGGIGILITNNYKLKKITGTQAEIKGESIDEPASSDPLEMNGAQITYDVRGLGEVTLLVDTQTGWIIRGSSRSHSQGNMEVKAQGQDFQIPMEVDSNSQITALQ